MTSHPLDGPRLKLRRANVHVESFERKAVAGFNGNAYAVVRERHPEEGRYVFRVKVNRPIQAAGLGLILGDAVHNFRSALDHLAWQLSYAERTYPETVASNPGDTLTQWPIFRTDTGFASRGQNQIQKIAPRAGAIIDAMQPYHSSDPLLDPLWLLRELDNTDKHRLIAVVAAVFNDSTLIGSLKIPPGKSIEMHVNTNAVEDGMELVTVQLPEQNPELEPNFKVTFAVKLGEIEATAPGIPYVLPILGAIANRVDYVIAVFQEAWVDGRYDDRLLPIVRKS